MACCTNKLWIFRSIVLLESTIESQSTTDQLASPPVVLQVVMSTLLETPKMFVAFGQADGKFLNVACCIVLKMVLQLLLRTGRTVNNMFSQQRNVNAGGKYGNLPR